MSRASRNKHAAPADSPTSKSIIGGFDLGTTNTVISVVEPDGKIKTIPNELGELTTPSAVFYDNDRILVGKSAIRASYKKPENFFRHIKPLMGSVDGNGNPIVIGFDPVNGKEITPITFSTNVLISLKGDCEKATGAKLKACTMGVPAYFTDTQREFTKLAGELAGLDVLKLVDEPIAAAIAYGLEKGQDMTLMVYDLGGGTFDCSIVRIQGGEVRVLDKSGDPKLGANDFLMRIVEFVLAAFKKEHGFELDPVDDAEDFLEILDRCEAGMKDLSVNETTLIACSGRGYRSKVELTRDGFNGLIHSCVLETHKHVQNALAKANLAPAGIDRVLLVGGGTRVCLVQSMLEVLMGQKPCRDVDPDLCVSIGAAVVAHEMSQRDDAPKSVKEYGKMLPPAPFRTRDISSFPVSIVVVAKDHTTRVHSEMIKAGNPIPASVTDRFHPVGDYAMSVRIWVTQGKNGEPFSESQAVASFDLPIAPLPECEGGDRIEVTYSLDESGIVVVKAKDHVSGNVVEGKTATKVALKKETIDREKDALIRKIA